MNRATLLSLVLFALASVVVSTPCLAQLAPCHDSDGDAWADPEFATDSCPPDNCPGTYNADQVNCYNVGDPVSDGAINVLDVVRSVDYAFRGMMPDAGAGCQNVLVGGTDVNCDGATSIVDVVKLVNVAFRGGVDDFCRPCSCDCYPEFCPELADVNNLLPNHGSFEKYCDSTLEGWRIKSFAGGQVALVDTAAPNGGRWSVALLGCWACAGTIEASIPHPVPGGIYRLSLYSKVMGPYPECCTSVFLRLENAGSTAYASAYSDSVWTYGELIDTIASGSVDDTLTVTLSGDFGQFPWDVMVDRVTLDYLGQAAP